MNIEIKRLTPADVEDYICYFDTTPHDGRIAGWCNANTKSEYQNCGGWLYTMPKIKELHFDQNNKVKSVYCFLIAPDMKRKGIAKKLLEYVCQDAINSGFHYVEVYPHKEMTDERTFFTGFVRMYKDLGFHIYVETEKRMVMRRQLNKEISVIK